jgi:hypothetical protein
VWILHSPNHVTKDCHDLPKKWEDKEAHCNMVTIELCENHKKDDEVDVWVITQGRENTGMNFEYGESLGQRLEGKIRKEV